MDQNLKGWFTERSPMWPGQGFSLQVKQVLLEKKSQYQDIIIFESTHHGRVLVLDGAIQCTESDEASYQEMISFLPLNAHPCPKKVLIVGGGDGGVAREVAKHPQVESIVHCEIDKEVIEACKEHIPSMGCGFDNPKHRLYTDDGAKFIEDTKEKFDVIITDASDPVVPQDAGGESVKKGPADSLFTADYFAKMKGKLEEGGILCCQGENMWLDPDLITSLMESCNQIYPVVKFAYTCTPTYPSGQIGFIICSTNKVPVLVTRNSLVAKEFSVDLDRVRQIGFQFASVQGGHTSLESVDGNATSESCNSALHPGEENSTPHVAPLTTSWKGEFCVAENSHNFRRLFFS